MCTHICARGARRLLALALFVIFAPVGIARASESPNLIVNGDAESGMAAGSGYDAVTIPGWQLTGLPTVVRYGQHADGITGTAGSLRGLTGADQFPSSSTPGPPDRGNQLFVGGPVGNSTLSQTVSLTGAAAAIDGGGVTYTLSGWLGGAQTDSSHASVSVTFLSASGSTLGSGTIGPVTSLQRLDTTRLVESTRSAPIPTGARSALVTLTMIDSVAPNTPLVPYYNNSYADDLSLRISAEVAAPPPPSPPPESVGRLQHVFMVFMENEGDGDIVGNAAAPYENSLIDRYGLATNYHAVEHPSDPNYIAFFGGATHGVDTDCALACTVQAPNLADQIEAAHES